MLAYTRGGKRWFFINTILHVTHPLVTALFLSSLDLLRPKIQVGNGLFEVIRRQGFASN